MQTFTQPKTGRDFVRFMEMVWDMHATPAPDGGITLRQSSLYDEFHDAIATARRFGMENTGNRPIGDKWWRIYRFPYDDGPPVAIEPSGNGVVLGKQRRRKSLSRN